MVESQLSIGPSISRPWKPRGRRDLYRVHLAMGVAVSCVGRCLAKTADSAAGARCDESNNGEAARIAAMSYHLERRACRLGQSNLRWRAERTSEPRYLLTRLAVKAKAKPDTL
jgi:hypothetical protein